MSHKKPEITFKYVFNYGYNPTYVNGAQVLLALLMRPSEV